MKKKISLALAVAMAVVFSGFAQNGQPGYAVSEVALSSFSKMVVDAEIDVVLVQNDTLKRAFIEGDDQLVSLVAVTVKNGILNISSRVNSSLKGKVQVTVTVQQLAELEINAQAGISSVNHIKAPRLDVSVNNNCDVHLKTTGKITFNTAEGFHINYVYNSDDYRKTQKLEKRQG